jgi:hypothetical protein
MDPGSEASADSNTKGSGSGSGPTPVASLSLSVAGWSSVVSRGMYSLMLPAGLLLQSDVLQVCSPCDLAIFFKASSIHYMFRVPCLPCLCPTDSVM